MSATPLRKRFAAGPHVRALLYRLTTSLAILLAIAYLTLFGLLMAERGQR